MTIKYSFYAAILLSLLFIQPVLASTTTIAELITLANKYNDPISQYLVGHRYLSQGEKKRDIDKAVKWLKQAANNGHLLAKYELGVLYYIGDGVVQNYSTAGQYLQEPADTGKDKAAFLLAKIYAQGLGVKENSKLAFKYFSVGANNYHSASLYEVAMCYFNGDGVGKNLSKAKEWVDLAIEYNAIGANKLRKNIIASQWTQKSPVQKYRTQAKKGDRKALYMMGKFYLDGAIDLRKNPNKAEIFLKKAAKKGHLKAQELLAIEYFRGNKLTPNIPMAEYWSKKSARWGSSIAQNILSQINETKKELEQKMAASKLKNINKALSKMMLAANRGNIKAQFTLAKTYMIGARGVAKNSKKAIEWYSRAADNGHLDSQYLLGRMYLENKFVSKNESIAQKWLTLAAEQGSTKANALLKTLLRRSAATEHPSIQRLRKSAKAGDKEAQFTLAEHYYNGQSVQKDLDKAALWYKKSAKQGHTEAQYQIGMMYSKGQGIRKSIASSKKWLQLAAKSGHRNAKNQLKDCNLKNKNWMFSRVNSNC